MPIHTFDHTPILLNTSVLKKNYKSFKFEEIWARDPNCTLVIKDIWDRLIAGSPSYILSQKLKAIRSGLNIWNKESFGHIQSIIKSLNNQLSQIQSENHYDSSLIKEENLKIYLLEQLRKEEIL